MAYTATAFPMLGVMPVPADFKYGDVLMRGRPRHEKWDRFSLKHPPMTAAKWAKIFSPFDALTGFDERIAEKEAVYEGRSELSDDERAEVDRRLAVLHNLTWNARMARANRVTVSVEFFVPCGDGHHFAYRTGAGTYETVTGTVQRVEAELLRLQTENGGKAIRFCDIRKIGNETGIFEAEWETETP